MFLQKDRRPQVPAACRFAKTKGWWDGFFLYDLRKEDNFDGIE